MNRHRRSFLTLLAASTSLGLVVATPRVASSEAGEPTGQPARLTPGQLAVKQRLEAIPESPPVILQWFESAWSTMARRVGDAFVMGYTGIWVPPPPGSARPGATPRRR